jgi:hypothetical protein
LAQACWQKGEHSSRCIAGIKKGVASATPVIFLGIENVKKSGFSHAQKCKPKQDDKQDNRCIHPNLLSARKMDP